MTNRTEVPCNGCTACCRGDAIYLHPKTGAYLRDVDNPTDYKCHREKNPITGRWAWCLDRDSVTNVCVYLGDNGCTIRDRAPIVCREFDCRALFLRFDSRQRKELVKNGFLDKSVISAGKQRLDTYTYDERLKVNEMINSMKGLK